MKRERLAIAAAILIGAAACAMLPGAAAAANESGAIPDAQIPPYITAAVNSPERPAADKALDAGRKPAQMLAFFGIKPGMQVLDLAAGAGYSTELLSLVVGPNGKVYSQNPDIPQLAKAVAAWRERLKKLSNVVALLKPSDDPNLLPLAPGSLDAAIINMNYHDLVHHGLKVEAMNRYIFKMLKPGGVYGVIDNSAAAGSGARDAGTLHRIDEQFVIDQVTKAGFRLDGESSVFRNAKDDRTWVVFKHRGEQDRFMLKFIKP